jgi:hypothetical protein
MPDALAATDHYGIVVAGDSHISTLGIPLASRHRGMWLHDLDWSWVRAAGLVGEWKGNRKLLAEWQSRADSGEEWKAHRNAAYWQALVAIAARKTVVLSWNGNQHNARFIFAPEPLFDFVSPRFAGLELAPGAEIVPHKVIKAHFAGSLAGLHALVDSLKQVPGCRPVILGSPPPKETMDRLMSLLVEGEYWRALAQRMGVDPDRPRLMPASIRLKLWGVVQELMEELAVQHGVEFLPCPAAALDGRGFLKENCWANDVTHANRRYGLLVEAELARIFRDGRRERASL